MSETSTSSHGLTGIELLTILFVGLKLTGYINWSWWWVLSPVWIFVGFVAACAIVAAVIDAVTK